MAYTRVNWENLPSKNTPVNADNLNKMDEGIKDLETELSKKANSSDIYTKTETDTRLNKMDEGIANAVEKTGDTMTGDLNMQSSSVKFGNNGNVLWKEDGYGDKFRIIPNFNGSGTNNKLIIQSTTGGVGTDPQNWKDLVAIHADSGQVDLIHPTYSTEEVRIGTWIDGKPLYRKVLTFKNKTITSNNNSSECVHNVRNLDFGIVREAYYDFNGENVWCTASNVITTGTDSYNVGYKVGRSSIYLKYISDISFNASNTRKWLFIIEYTKTTD